MLHTGRSSSPQSTRSHSSALTRPITASLTSNDSSLSHATHYPVSGPRSEAQTSTPEWHIRHQQAQEGFCIAQQRPTSHAIIATTATEPGPIQEPLVVDKVAEHLAVMPQAIQIHGTKRPASNEPHPMEAPVKKQTKWSKAENEMIIELRGMGMKWEDVSRRLSGRSPVSCRLHYQNFLEKRAEWDEEKKIDWRDYMRGKCLPDKRAT